MPLVEIYVIIQVGQAIGPWWTILLLIADSILGSWLVKREGARAWRALRSALDEGRMPATELADGMLILVGGLLMLTPGFVLDIVGALCILPFTRPIGRRALSGFVSRRLTVATFPGAASYGAGAGIRDRDADRPDQTVAPDRMWSGATSSTEPAQDDPRAEAQALVFLRWPVQVRRADLAAAEQLQALGEDVLELLDGAALEQHVPVRAGRLLGLDLGLDARRRESASAPQRGHSHTAGTRPRRTS